jgi:hypothetical protein
MRNLITPSTLKEIAVFAGAYAAIQGFGYIKSTMIDSCFKSHPMIVKHGFVSILQPLHNIMPPNEFEKILDSLEEFITMCENGDVRKGGFMTNRLATRWISEVESFIRTTRSHKDVNTAMIAISYEKDQLPILKSMIDDIQRNMLLDYLS